MHWNWRAEGFTAPPLTAVAPPGLRLYRAWGGASTKTGNPQRPGVCLSTQRPTTRAEAERLFAAWEWGNSCLWRTEFRVVPGTRIHIGHADPGQVLDATLRSAVPGVQVLVENPVHGKLVEVLTMRLIDDLRGIAVLGGSRSTH